MASKTKITYKAYGNVQKYEATRNALLQAEQTHYLLTLQNEELDGSLVDRTATAANEVTRLQDLFAAAEKDLPQVDGPQP